MKKGWTHPRTHADFTRELRRLGMQNKRHVSETVEDNEHRLDFHRLQLRYPNELRAYLIENP